MIAFEVIQLDPPFTNDMGEPDHQYLDIPFRLDHHDFGDECKGLSFDDTLYWNPHEAEVPKRARLKSFHTPIELVFECRIVDEDIGFYIGLES